MFAFFGFCSFRSSMFGAALVFVLMANPALAIPSPELVIGSISSISQLFALATAMLGGGAVAAGARAGWKRGAGGGSSKNLLRLTASLGLLAVLAMVGNILQFSNHGAKTNDRLISTLTRPAQSPGTRILDPNLKETSFADQQTNPLGITTEHAAHLLQTNAAGQSDVLFLDVREDAEHEMGTIPGANHVRFPDISQSNLDLSGRQIVLFWYNGNRSSETCARLAALGIDCKFISGGIEKWILESKDFTDETVRSLSEMRAIPSYQNGTTLLDTPAVKTLIANEDIQFVDVRYPLDFETQHLPGAINIPLRALPSAEVVTRINALSPDRPIVAACYDRRSCFISQVLGLSLTRAGYDFRGRYTLPWEYFVPKTPKPHIAAWLEENNKSYWQMAVSILASGLLLLAQISHILIAILALSLASRLLILPISLKAERDQITTNRVADDLKALKAHLKEDPPRLARAIKAFYRKHGLTPMRNILALAFLPLMMLGLSAVQMAATDISTGFLWVDDIGRADTIYLLPLVFTLLACTYLHVSVAKSLKQKQLYWVIGAPILFAMVFSLSAAGVLYLICSITLLLVQRVYVIGGFDRLTERVVLAFQAARVRYVTGGLIPLGYPDQLKDCGNKAYRLAVMKRAGIPVPSGLVLNTAFLNRFRVMPAGQRQAAMVRTWTMAGNTPVAVRSSAGSEDGEKKSFAGVFDSYLNIGRDDLEAAVWRVADSFRSARAESYDSGATSADDGNILIQQMVDAKYAGVLFTQDPEAPGQSIIEMVEGTADDLVSGKVIPTTVRFGRFSGRPMGNELPPINLGQLLKIGKHAEELFGAPQDIEWTYLGGRFSIVQSRDITTLSLTAGDGPSENSDWQAIFNSFSTAHADEKVLERDEMSEVLPRPTPLSLSYMEALWANGGSVDLACRRLGLTYSAEEGVPGHLVTLFGRLYSDTRRKNANAVRLSKVLAKRLTRNNTQIEDDYRFGFLPWFNKKMVLLENINFNGFSQAQLCDFLGEQYQKFVTDTHVEVEVISIAASFYMSSLTRSFEQANIDPTCYLADQPPAGPAAIFKKASSLSDDLGQDFLLKEMGHRAVFDYELNHPRYAETPDVLASLAAAGIEPAIAGGTASSRPALPQELTELTDIAARYQSLKEDAKHQSLRQLAVIRRAVLALDKKLELNGLCFFLKFSEIIVLTPENTERLLEKARLRREKYRAHLKAKPLPTSLTLVELEAATGSAGIAHDHAGMISGKRVSGSGQVTSHAYVTSPEQAENGVTLDSFADGDILVCPLVHPAWLPYVLRAGGVVSEVGGWLSHIAIVARENDIPMIVATTGQSVIMQGDQITLNTDGGIEIVSSDSSRQQTVIRAAE